MKERPTGRAPVYRTQRRDECMELQLVLHSTGISAEAKHEDGGWVLTVPAYELARSTAEIDAYLQENTVSSRKSSIAFPGYGGGAIAVATYAFVILVIATWDAVSAFDMDWQSAGAMEAGKVAGGQWWRCVTALTLHVDAGHLIANLVFGVLFGLIAGRILGGGVAGLGMVLAGALGNLVNAMLRAPTHSSIGASTAVFAALGMIVFHAIGSGWTDRQTMMKRWSPLIGGLVLFAYTGIGSERTDVVAHATGFSAGMLLGWIGCQAPPHWLASKNVQVSAGCAAIALIAIAWIVGLSGSLDPDVGVQMFASRWHP